MSDNEMSRRGVMGVLAAASVGKMSSVSGADNVGTTEQETSPSSDHLGDYANRAGRIGIDGLNEAIDDWGNGVISSTERDAVIEAWNLGDRVVDKTVIQWDSNISEATTWEPDPDDQGRSEPVVYQITSNIGVNAQLTIKPGTVIEFKQGTALNINSGPILAQAKGDTEILMTATVAKRGWWNGVAAYSGDLQNTMENVKVEYGGRGNYRGCLDISGGSIAVTGCTLRYSAAYGMYQTSGGTLIETGDNVYANNREAGVRTVTSKLHQLSASSTHVDNDRNYVFVAGNSANDAGADEETRNLENLDVPYRLQGGHSFNNLTLTIDPGTIFEFTQSSRLTFYGGSRIAIEGTGADPIVFTGTTKKRGWWDGIYIDGTTDTENVFDHCVFEYGANDLSSNLSIASGSRDSGAVEVTNCVFRNAGGFGMEVGGSSELRNAENNTYTGNVDGAARIGTENMQSLSSTSTFTGNDNEYVLVRPRDVSGSGRDEDAREWDALDVPYRLNGSHNVNNMELSIEPGATFEFTEDARLTFNNDTRLSISGMISETEEVDPITFTGTQEERGWWRGIYLDDTTDQENSMEYCIFEYGGSSDWDGVLSIGTGSRDAAYLQFSHCTFRNCSRYGVAVGGGATIENLFDNTYTGNGEGAMRIGTEDAEALSSDSDFTGNDDDYVLVTNRGIDGDGAADDTRTWDAINVPYRMAGGTHGINNVQFEIDPGATLNFTEDSGMTFYSGSVFNIQGEEGNEVTFSATQENRGWWDGIYIDDTTSQLNTLKYVIIEYAGKNSSNQLAIATGSRDSALIQEISNCTFRNGTGYGIENGSGTQVRNMANNTYTGHSEGAVFGRTDTIHELNGNSDFTGNDKDRVVVANRNLEQSEIPGGQDGVTWDALNVPYEMQEGDHVINVPLSIEPGADFKFQQASRLKFNPNSEIDITGTSDNKITFATTDPAVDNDLKGWWDGIYVDDTTSQLNTMTHTVIQRAGGSGTETGPSVNIASGSRDNGFLRVENCTIRKSGGDGIYTPNASYTNSDVCEVNTFLDNNGSDCNIGN